MAGATEPSSARANSRLSASGASRCENTTPGTAPSSSSTAAKSSLRSTIASTNVSGSAASTERSSARRSASVLAATAATASSVSSARFGTTPTATTGRWDTIGLPSPPRIGARSGSSLVVPSRSSPSSSGWTASGAKRTIQSSSPRTRSSSVEYVQPPILGTSHAISTLAVAASPSSETSTTSAVRAAPSRPSTCSSSASATAASSPSVRAAAAA